MSSEDVTAVHLEGGNAFDDMRIDIARSHERFASLTPPKKRVQRGRLHNVAKLYLVGLALSLRLHELLVVNGIRRRWLDDFQRYWSGILGGRPFWSTLDFFLLLHDYRKRSQQTTALGWSDASQHVAHWQDPSHLYATLANVRELAIHPIRTLRLWKRVSPGMRLLEYGCSAAPYYHCYREFFTHRRCTWVLADIPNFPFHYAKYLYRGDDGVELVTIDADDFAHPLGDRGDFDVILLTTVFEHLDDPLRVFEYLRSRLKPGGLLVFDYIKSEGKGLDHPAALEMRRACLTRILETMELVEGRIGDMNESVGLCMARKRAG